MLDTVDAELRRRYPGSNGRSQPIHTVYVPADRVAEETPAEWGATAIELLDRHYDLLATFDDTGSLPDVRKRLELDPVQDLRIDFEDGYGVRPDPEEDRAAIAAGAVLAAWSRRSDGPPVGESATGGGADEPDPDLRRGQHVARQTTPGARGQRPRPVSSGIRMKGLGVGERRRALRTLDLVLESAGGVPDGFVFTVPKIRAAQQVPALVQLCVGLERGYGIAEGSLRFELQIESPQAILAADGTAPVATMLTLAEGRCSALHFGTYDYTAACGVAAPDQALDHPAADYAKAVMQVAAAQSGVWVCDGSTQVVPDANPEAALRNHHRLVARALRRGYYQGWDMHPGHLVTRWLATYDFFRRAIDVAVPRLLDYLARRGRDVMDEPATAEALAATVLRGIDCGARPTAGVPELTETVLRALAARAPIPEEST
ncbi:aldolase [Nocardia amamiensis]|uniref:Aldolase n=2 Tax=Nocardia amamiensis TaxID=404578 RepID=A0ABS0CQ54_9NOCA|nr:aldolase [Nocardia amamiensis]